MKLASIVKLSVVLYAWSDLWCMIALFVWARCRKDFFKSFRILDWRTTKHSEQLMLYNVSGAVRMDFFLIGERR
jgi:hypothetical protein